MKSTCRADLLILNVGEVQQDVHGGCCHAFWMNPMWTLTNTQVWGGITLICEKCPYFQVYVWRICLNSYTSPFWPICGEHMNICIMLLIESKSLRLEAQVVEWQLSKLEAQNSNPIHTKKKSRPTVRIACILADWYCVTNAPKSSYQK
jgi:hypothetical protein